MTNTTLTYADRKVNTPSDTVNLLRVGHYVTLYGLVLVFGWIGAMKFTPYEAAAIEGLISSSPLLAWLYSIFDERGAANLIGAIEITAAAALALRPWSAVTGALGAALVAATTVVTLTFLLSAPVWESSLGGFPALSVLPGQFLIKDAVLLGAALWLLGDALREIGAAR